MSENDFERALAESFDNAYNSNVPISTSEANNVNDIFVGNEVQTECIICYEEDSPCIKCFQCTAVYCKICLTKIASESNKCICSIDIRNNYSKLKKYNQNLIKKAKEDKEKADKTKRDKAKRDKAIKEKEERQRLERQNTLNNNNSNYNTNTQTSLNYDYINNHIINNSSNSNLNRNSDSNVNSATNLNKYNSNLNDTNLNNRNLNDKLNFIKDLTDNKIYNIDFKSFCNELNNTTPNFDYLWDYQHKTLTFYTVPNTNQELKNIVINYNILNAEYQAEIYVYILELLKLPFSQFKKNWNKIADIFPKITENNKTLLVSNIVEICRG